MTLNEAKALVKRLRRHFYMASILRMPILTLVAIGLLGSMLLNEAQGHANALWYAAMFAALLWILLTVFSVRQVRAANQASAYIASGRLDLAEEQLKSALHQFSLYRAGKLLACHNLAVVVHGRKNYQAAAELCDAVITLHGGVSRSVGRLCRILLADCRLLLGDSASALRAIEPLSLRDPALSLSEQMMLLPIELRCQIAMGQYESAWESLAWKVRLAELLDAPKASLVHALLARACQAAGKTEEASFLQRRADLYHDQKELAEDYNIPQDSAPVTPTADNNADSAS